MTKNFQIFKALKFVILILFGIWSLKFGTSSALAASDTPFPQIKLPCDKTKNPEFSSLRPYQAATCGDAEKAYFCSNNLIFTETFQDFPQCKAQAPADGRFICDLGPSGKVIPNHNLVVDLADSFLPILGNTELAKNSQNNTDQIDSGTKMSEYVSWYLNGTLNRAEYGLNDTSKIADNAGPVQKIMPQAILEAQRIATINTASAQTPQISENDTPTGQNERSNHDQIVACAKKEYVLGPLGKLLGLVLKANPYPCYEKGTPPNDDLYRLKSWDESFTENIADNVFNYISSLIPNNFLGVITKDLLMTDRWRKKTPPLPWDNGSGKPFIDATAYQKAYNEWRGEYCAILPPPFPRTLICFNIPGVSNQYADLFPYVPLGNTVDKKGAEADFIAEIQPSEGTEIINKSYDTPKGAPLWFSSAQQVKDLSEFLNKSYTPKDFKPGSVNDTEVNDCRIVNVRSNPGDNLFPGQPSGITAPNVRYTITKVPCTVSTETKTNKEVGKPCTGPVGTTCTQKFVKCDAEVNITLPTSTKTPWAEQIWNSTVASSNSTFRRIYPKTGPNAPVSCIANVPTETKVTYTPKDSVGNGDKNFKVKDPSGANTTDNPTLLFPFIGSVYDYFLKGIQQALRPQGYGDGTPQSGQYCGNTVCGELPSTLPKASGSCSLGGTSPNVGNIPGSLKQIVEAASQTFKTPPNLILGIMYGEGLFNPGRFNWTDQNVKNWSTCQKIPNCNETGDDNFMGFNGNDFANIVKDPAFAGVYKKIDPTRTKYSQCNLMDTVFAEAYNLNKSAAGGGGLPPTCFGIPLKSTIPNSCSWNNSQYESAIKVAESGYTSACLTKEGSCATGGGLSAACSSGDTCETIGNRYANPSHNACVWDVSQGK